MPNTRLTLTTLALAFCCTARISAAAAPADDPPVEWIDSVTGHRVIRLSKEPDSASLYFHQNAYSPDGKLMLITTPGGLATVDLETRHVKPLVDGPLRVMVVGPKSGDAYYVKDGTLFATNLRTRATRELAKLPPGGSVSTLNADETLVAGAVTEGDAPPLRPRRPPATAATTAEGEAAGPAATATTPASTATTTGPATSQVSDERRARGVSIEERWNLRLPMSLLTVNVRTGETKTFNRGTDWLNHFQFSPTDPHMLLFCHEGPWHKVDRVWTVRTNGDAGDEARPQRVHVRTMNMEIAGHEFWSFDGKTVWYDLQTPRGESFWLAGLDIETGRRTRYHLQRDEWSVHFNVSRDGALFAGDGGDDRMVAGAANGKWIYLFRPELLPDRSGDDLPGKDQLIRPGVLRAERLVDMSKHDYRLEPNVTFTPDGKHIVFRSNMFGPTHVFAVEVAKAH